ncbi:MAG: enhanced serine sensitivity protein SseB C-terminal domain-containing protein [Firmicutes bacterium]|nr:enhanced serine sensitivity protein SseB C-terminal domain-containing protein [Bacillota bacterium]
MNNITINEPTEVLIGDPRKIPKKLLKKLVEFFELEPLVKKAYLKWMAMNGQCGYLILLNADETYRDILFPKIGAIIDKYLKRGYYADLMLLDESLYDTIKDSKPFFKR